MNANEMMIVSLRLGEIREIYFNHRKKDNLDPRMYCKIFLDTGVFYENVPFYGGSVDTITKNLHGVFDPPTVGQMVGVQFVNGNFENPYAAFSIPHPWPSNERGITPEDLGNAIQEQLEDVENTGIFNKSGSKIVEKKDGTIHIRGKKASPSTNEDQIEEVVINEGTDFAVRYNELLKIVQELQNDIGDLKTVFSTTWVVLANDGGAALKTAAATWAGTALVEDMTKTKVDNVRVPKKD